MQSFTLFYGTSIIILLLVSVSKSHGLLEEAVCPAERGAICALYRQPKALDVRSHRLLQVRTDGRAVVAAATRRDAHERILSLPARHYDKDNHRLIQRTTTIETDQLLNRISRHRTIRERVLSQQRVTNRDTIVHERENSRQFRERSTERQRLGRHVERISGVRDAHSDRRFVRDREQSTIRQSEPLARDTRPLDRVQRSIERRQPQLVDSERTQRNVLVSGRRTTNRENSAQVVRVNRQRSAVERVRIVREVERKRESVRRETRIHNERRINVHDSLVTRQLRDTISDMSNKVRRGDAERRIIVRNSRTANERRSVAARGIIDERRNMDQKMVRATRRHLAEELERVRSTTDLIQHYERLPAKIPSDGWTLQLVQFVITCILLAQVSGTKKANENIFTRFVPFPMFSQLVKEKVQ